LLLRHPLVSLAATWTTGSGRDTPAIFRSWPKKFLQVSAAGANEGDFVMLLGYPGRTARHKTASFLEFEQNVRLPHVVDYYGQQIETMQAAGANDRAVAIKLLSRIARLANVEKRSRGQLKGLAGANIAANRRAKEKELQEFIDASPDLQARYGQTLAKIDAAYAEVSKTAVDEANTRNLLRASQLMSLAFTIYDGAVERQKPDLERESAYMTRNYDQTVASLRAVHRDLELKTDQQLLGQLLDRMDDVQRTGLGLPAAGQLGSMYERCQLSSPTAFATTKGGRGSVCSVGDQASSRISTFARAWQTTLWAVRSVVW